MTDLPWIDSYSEEEIRGLSWPAIERYLQIIKNLKSKSQLTESESIRLVRHEAWLRATLATALNRTPAEDVCAYWSLQAEKIIADAWVASGCVNSNFALLGLGKLGAGELNLSSDVDLIVLREEGNEHDTKCVRLFQKLLSETTEHGFALRVDFTLRPGGSASPLVPSFGELENYYGYHGETWERLAYVRMRILQGPESLTNKVLKFASRFAYRRHLDYTLLDELRSLRTKMRQEKFESRPNMFHLKLGIGGIRELELFVHVLQVIHGGRHSALRTDSTTEALTQLGSLQLLPENEAQELKDIYWWYRDLENRLQGYEDQQTYMLELKKPSPAHSFSYAERLSASRRRVCEITDTFFGTGAVEGRLPSDLENQKVWLEQKGFSTSSREQTWPEILSVTAVSRQSARDEEARLQFLDGFVSKLAETGVDRDLGLALLLDFIRSTRAKASFFTLLNRETRVRDEIATLFSISPYLGSVLASRPELIDEFILRRLHEPSGDWDTLLDELAERRLLAELISANRFLADRDLRMMSLNLTVNADSICKILLDKLKEDYGPSSVEIVALGKWGGRELGLRSDLDFIFLVDGEATANDQKVSKRFLSRITEPHRGGSIYAVDMRLRPSGKAGPILVSREELKAYLSGNGHAKAAAWERQAYLRSRALFDLDFLPGELASASGLNEAEISELKMIRSKLFTNERPDELDLKLTFGGLADVEFTAQIALLSRREFSLDPSTYGMIQYLEGVDASWARVGSSLRERYDELRRIEQLFQLTTSQSGSKMRLKSEEFQRLSLVLKATAPELEAKIRKLLEEVRELLRDVQTL